MKVGTDGVLLGAWVRLTGAERQVLDIGTGTGVIALMLAQRTDGFSAKPRIDAVEVETQAAGEARGNFGHTPWSDRLGVTCGPVQEFGIETEGRYELIVSNPPYFMESLKPPGEGRTMARHTELLPYDQLIRAVSRLLDVQSGRFAAIFPTAEFARFAQMAQAAGLRCIKRLEVRGRAGKAIKRIAGEFALRPLEGECVVETLCIEDQAGFTAEYRNLTRDFYLKF